MLLLWMVFNVIKYSRGYVGKIKICLSDGCELNILLVYFNYGYLLLDVFLDI